METRELAYFVAVAEELHFGRAATRLGIAQPPLSRAIRQLERRLGVTLLERTSRSVALTAAGEVLLREGRAALDAVAAADRRTRRAGHPAAKLVLATKSGAAGDLLPALLSAYTATAPAATIEVLLCGIGEQERLLRDGRADVALLHLPFDDTTGLDIEELHTEGQVAVLPAGHRLAARTHLLTADLAGEPFPTWPGATAAPAAPASPGPLVRDSTQLYQLIALGMVVATLPSSCRSQLRPDLVAVPVLDAPTVTTVIAWPPHSRSPALATLIRCAMDLSTPAPLTTPA
ncbi:LysR substrate-binding domain-containing protein [Dactylosporangium sp. NPDC049742]|uniref:LysR family transcriptional regulator n=1 Tax=Dactylosporangium sp. NPDC049742 TaxID=3154737 RepID=UPI00343D22E4